MTEVLPETQHPVHDHQPPAVQAAPVMPIPAHPQPMPAMPAAGHPSAQVSHPDGRSVAHRGREKLHWSKDVWDCIDAAVRREVKRTRVAARFLPVHRVPEHTTTVPADLVIEPVPVVTPILRWSAPPAPAPTFTSDTVDEGAVVRLVEFWVEFSLTPQQVEEEGRVDHGHHHHGHEHDHHEHERDHHAQQRAHHEQGRDHASQSTAVTLATRAANVLAQAEDMIIFNGYGAFSTPLFSNVRWRPSGQPSDFGLLDVIPWAPPNFPVPPAVQVISVPQLTAPLGQPSLPPYTYLENTFQYVAEGYSQLMGRGQYGPFALTLHQIPYADTYSPLANTLIATADRIHPLMTAGFWDSGTLDAPGYQAAILAAAAAGNPPNSVAAANAAGAFAITYGADPGMAAGTAAAAATANGSDPNAQQDGQTAAFTAASAIPGYPGLPPAATNITVKAPLPNFYGSLVSLGGNTMDLVRGIDATAGFMQQDTDGSYRFRVMERMGLRIKDYNAIIRLEFD